MKTSPPRRRGRTRRATATTPTDESTKRMLRRALLKAVAIPGYQVPFGKAEEMLLPYGWGTGGIQVTASIIEVLGRCSR